MLGSYGLVETYHECTASGEVYAVVHAAHEERCHGSDDENYRYHIGIFAYAEEVGLCIGKEILGKAVREFNVLFFLKSCDEDQPRDEYRSEQRSYDTYYKCGSEALYGTRTEDEEHYTGDERRDVGVEDRRHCVPVTGGDGGAETLTGAQFLLDTFVYKNVGIHRHTHGKHYTRDTGQRQYGAECG